MTVENTGKTAAKTTAALWFSKRSSKFVRYHKMLAAFVKTAVIGAGEQAEVVLTVRGSALSSYDMGKQAQAVEHGVYLLRLAQDAGNDYAGALNVTVG